MKLATLSDGSRDGTLLIVSRDLTRAVRASGIARTLQDALDAWYTTAPKLKEMSDQLNAGRVEGEIAVDPRALMAPLPRAYQWADGSAYVNHVELVRKARGAEMPPSFWTDPLMYQGGSDGMIGPCAPVRLADAAWGIDFEAEVAVITGDVPMGVAARDAGRCIQLVALVNDVSLRNLIPAELAKGFGFFQSKPSSSFSPCALTPDELGDAWDGRKLSLPLVVHRGDTLFGRPNAGVDMTFDFPTLIAHAAKTRPLAAGTIIGSGTVSNKDRSAGSACIAEVRCLETIESGAPRTPFLQFGERVRIEMLDAKGRSIFGAIDQVIERYEGP